MINARDKVFNQLIKLLEIYPALFHNPRVQSIIDSQIEHWQDELSLHYDYETFEADTEETEYKV